MWVGSVLVGAGDGPSGVIRSAGDGSLAGDLGWRQRLRLSDARPTLAAIPSGCLSCARPLPVARSREANCSAYWLFGIGVVAVAELLLADGQVAVGRAARREVDRALEHGGRFGLVPAARKEHADFVGGQVVLRTGVERGEEHRHRFAFVPSVVGRFLGLPAIDFSQAVQGHRAGLFAVDGQRQLVLSVEVVLGDRFLRQHVVAAIAEHRRAMRGNGDGDVHLGFELHAGGSEVVGFVERAQTGGERSRMIVVAFVGILCLAMRRRT